MMSKLWRSKLKAFAAHILFSAALIGSFMYVVMVHWFPGYLFEFENVWEGLRILVPVDAILGPILTLILFVPGKKGLKGDIAIILILQIAALLYGGKAIYDSKPEVLAFVGDRFEVITSKSYQRDRVPEATLVAYDKGYPALIYPLPGQTPEEVNEFVLNNVQYQIMAERYRPLAGNMDLVLSRALDIDRLQPSAPQQIKLLADFKQRFNDETDALFILQGTTKEFIVVSIDKVALVVKDYLPLDPWDIYVLPE